MTWHKWHPDNPKRGEGETNTCGYCVHHLRECKNCHIAEKLGACREKGSVHFKWCEAKDYGKAEKAHADNIFDVVSKHGASLGYN